MKDIRESQYNKQLARPLNLNPVIPHEARNPGNYHVAQDIQESKIENKLLPKLKYERDVLNKLQKRPEKCNARKNNIFFLKIHKAGSATVQNILLRLVWAVKPGIWEQKINFSRYGEKYDLTFALPKQPAAHIYNYNVKFNADMVRKGFWIILIYIMHL